MYVELPGVVEGKYDRTGTRRQSYLGETDMKADQCLTRELPLATRVCALKASGSEV